VYKRELSGDAFGENKMIVPYLGVGMGYRMNYHADIIRERKHIDFLEATSDQFLHGPKEKTDALLEAAGELPIVPHSLAMSVGSATPVDSEYLALNSKFVELVNGPWFSDHLCMTHIPEVDLGSLTPLWFTEEVVERTVTNIKAIKRKIPDRPFLVENITYYLPLPASTMSESLFITKVVEGADCGLLLDINNVYVNSQNLGFDPQRFLLELPLERVVQVHIAGFEPQPELIIDTHDTPVADVVWDLLDFLVRHSPVKAISLERDGKYPPFSQIVDELQHARNILARHGVALGA